MSCWCFFLVAGLPILCFAIQSPLATTVEVPRVGSSFCGWWCPFLLFLSQNSTNVKKAVLVVLCAEGFPCFSPLGGERRCVEFNENLLRRSQEAKYTVMPCCFFGGMSTFLHSCWPPVGFPSESHCGEKAKKAGGKRKWPKDQSEGGGVETNQIFQQQRKIEPMEEKRTKYEYDFLRIFIQFLNSEKLSRIF